MLLTCFNLFLVCFFCSPAIFHSNFQNSCHSGALENPDPLTGRQILGLRQLSGDALEGRIPTEIPHEFQDVPIACDCDRLSPASTFPGPEGLDTTTCLPFAELANQVLAKSAPSYSLFIQLQWFMQLTVAERTSMDTFMEEVQLAIAKRSCRTAIPA